MLDQMVLRSSIESALKKQQNFAYFFPRSASSLLAGKARFSEIL
jgi:hypothetical protein